MLTPFTNALTSACHKPLSSSFHSGYLQVLQNAAQAGAFKLHGLQVSSPEGVYTPHEGSTTRMVMDRFHTLGLTSGGGTLLEVGCGAGAIAMLAARNGWEVTASDIDPRAVQATLTNAAVNGIQLQAVQSDLFEGFRDQTFDVIVFNQPFYHLSRPVSPEEIALADFQGQLHVRFMRQARSHLKPGGRVLFTYSNCSAPELLYQRGWDTVLMAFDYEASAHYVRAIFQATPSHNRDT
jgi:methylase of polypeptide subunit release factors